MRLDRAMLERGLARSRTHAQELIVRGLVAVDGNVEIKPSRPTTQQSFIDVLDDGPLYVSRAAYKLKGALDELAPCGLEVAGRLALDAGASTGGFTQVLLEYGAAHVTAIDVGHGQLDPLLAQDARVTNVEGFNLKDLDATSPGAGAQLVVADVSFISLTHVVGPIRTAAPEADLVLMIKPQFELSRAALDKHGVVTKAADRARALERVCDALESQGEAIMAMHTSVLPGPSGNVEFFVWARQAWQARAVTMPQAMDQQARKARIVVLTEGKP